MEHLAHVHGYATVSSGGTRQGSAVLACRARGGGTSLPQTTLCGWKEIARRVWRDQALSR